VKTTLRSIVVLAFTCALSAASLEAQTDPLNPSASQTQPNQPGRVQAPTTSMMDSSGAPADTIQEMKDKIFLRKATEGGLAQVQLGQLASTNASSPEVKQLGQRLADDHTKLNASMAMLADSIGMRLPKNLNKADQAEYEKLKALSGEAFDKEYLSCMVRDHHEDLHAFRVESQTTTDPDLKATVDQGARVLHEHLGMVSRLAVQNGVPLPTRGGKPPVTSPAP
jgi:putative membrane protein